MKDIINVSWVNNMAFEANVDNHKLLFDAKPESGGKNSGPRPKPLLMASLAGCTGMDVISILKKMKIEVDSFNIKAEGIISDDHPKQFLSIHLIYEFTGNNLPLDKINHAIELSQEKYCGVSATLQKAIPVTYETKIN